MQKTIYASLAIALFSLSVAFAQTATPFTYQVEKRADGTKQVQFSANAPDGSHSFNWTFNNGQITSSQMNPQVDQNSFDTHMVEVELTYSYQGEELHTRAKIDTESISQTLLHPNKTEVIEMRSDKLDFPQIPNVFTPNGDSVNDYFEVKVSESTQLVLKVFSRIGMLVYEKEASFIHWDGKNYYGQDLPDGIYYYVLRDTENLYNPTTGFLYIYR